MRRYFKGTASKYEAAPDYKPSLQRHFIANRILSSGIQPQHQVVCDYTITNQQQNCSQKTFSNTINRVCQLAARRVDEHLQQSIKKR